MTQRHKGIEQNSRWALVFLRASVPLRQLSFTELLDRHAAPVRLRAPCRPAKGSVSKSYFGE
jgi:hypothetical protein